MFEHRRLRLFQHGPLQGTWDQGCIVVANTIVVYTIPDAQFDRYLWKTKTVLKRFQIDIFTTKGGFHRPGKNRKSLVSGGGGGGGSGGSGDGGGDNGGGAGQWSIPSPFTGLLQPF